MTLRISRLSLAAWVAALVAAAVPTVESLAYVFFPEQGFICVSAWGREPDLTAVLGSALFTDARTVIDFAVLWGVPALLVLAALGVALVTGDASGPGRRTGAFLALLAVARPLVFPYFDVEACARVAAFGREWFARVWEAYGALDLALPVAAVLVLVASQHLHEGASAGAPGLAVRRSAALAVDYLVVLLGVTLLGGGWASDMESGLLGRLAPEQVAREPLHMLLPLALFFYVLPRRTPGKWLLRVATVQERPGAGWPAVRAVVFPVLAFVPVVGVAVVVVDVACAVLTGRPLHDRLAGTAVEG